MTASHQGSWSLGPPDADGVSDGRSGEQRPGPCLLLHRGRTAHLRHTPFRHRFGYRLWMLSADLDRIDHPVTRLFGHNRFAPLSFHDRDHGPRDGSPLAPWVRTQLAAAALAPFGAHIRFMAIPRVFGWAFNPIGFYFCFDTRGRLGAVLHQVKNTFGDQHGYLLPVDPPEAPGGQVRQAAAKRLHVSPFFDLAGGYRFAFRAPDFSPGGRFDLSIRYGLPDAPRMTATLSLSTATASRAALLATLIRQPLTPVKVVSAIHWQALRLWLRGASFHAAPHPPAAAVTFGSTP